MKRVYRSACASIAILLFSVLALTAQENTKVKWKLLTDKVEGKPGDVVQVKIQATLDSKSHLYSMRKVEGDGPQPTVITVGEKSVVTLSGTPKGDRRPIRKYDEQFEDTTEFWDGKVTFTVPVKIAKKAKPGEATAWVNFYFMTCDDKSCMPPTDKKLELTVTVKEDSSLGQVADSGETTTAGVIDSNATTPADTTPQTAAAPSGSTNSPSNGAGSAATAGAGASTSSIDLAAEQGLLALIMASMLGGLFALATPCVFPMVPITVSFFTKQANTSKLRVLRDAGLYSLSIILTFTGIGVIASAIFGATAVRDLATDPIFNVALAVLFVALALSLLGLYEIQLPTSLINRLNRKATGEGNSPTGIMLMGVVFTLTSFTCTVGVVAGLLGLTSSGQWFNAAIGMLAFSTVFALPFFLLALFPSLLKSLPKSGGWLNSVKVVMGFIEIGAAIKFFSNADLVMQWGVLTRELFLAIWIAITVLIVLYLLGRFHLPHDSPVEKVGPIRALLATTFLAFGFWMLTGLIGGRLGEIDAIAPPQEYPGKGNTSPLATILENGGTPAMTANTTGEASKEGRSPKKEHGETGWLTDDYEGALELARETGRPVFVDFTGYTCTNCRWMERNMFTRPEISELMNKYVRVRLFTDGRKPHNEQFKKMQFDRYKTIALPFYVLVTPSDSVIGTFADMTRDSKQFVSFLEKGTAQNSWAAADVATRSDRITRAQSVES